MWVLAVAGLGVITPVINDINWPGFCLPPIRKCGCVGGGAGAGHQSDTHLPIQQGGGRLWHLPLHTLKCDHNVHNTLCNYCLIVRDMHCARRGVFLFCKRRVECLTVCGLIDARWWQWWHALIWTSDWKPLSAWPGTAWVWV